MDNFNPFSLAGKNILVTGASSGIGKAISILCSKLGANIIATGRNKDRLSHLINEMQGDNNIIISADLTREDDIEKLVEMCPELNGIVHSAGIMNRIPSKMISNACIEKIMSSNFNAPVLLQKQLIKKKKIITEASIVFIASRAPFAPSFGNSLYAASKGAIISYAKVLALELASKLIRVNCICPGMVWTNLVKKDEEMSGIDYRLKEEEYPLKRFGQPEDVAFLAIYMLSDTSKWMTGSVVDIDGGGELTLV